MQPCQLDGVLDRLRTCVEECAPRLTGDGCQPTQPFGNFDVQLIGDDGEIGVQKAVGLVVDRLHDPWMAVSDVQNADASDEVDEPVAVDVRERGALRFGRDDGRVYEQWPRHGLPLSLDDRARSRAGNLRLQLDNPGHRHASERIGGAVRCN